MKKFSKLIWGLILVAVGVILCLNALNITEFTIFFKGWWTLFIIIPSATNMVERGFKFSSLFFLLLGVGFLLSAQGIISYEMLSSLIWPVILILVGLSMIMRFLFGYSIKDEMQRIEKNNIEHFTAFGSQEYSYNGEKFLGANVDTVFGSAVVNLSGANIKSDTVLKISTLFGKTLLRVPDNVDIKISKTSIFGGVMDKRTNKSKNNKYTLYIETFNLFGGLDINE